ncbi:MAG: DnaD domain protein [Clostridia bacterium]|nr:DnaD domain protein [Clostridia bacterium]
MEYRLGKGSIDGLLVLPGGVLEHLNEAGDAELRVLLYLAEALKSGGMEEEAIVASLEEQFSREEILVALAFWRGCGILLASARASSARKKNRPVSEPSEKREAPAKKTIDADEAPFYSAKDLAEAAETVPDFKALVSFAEGRLEKVMNASELARLYSFLDYLKMPLDVVMMVIEDCVAREKKSLRYITKMLSSFQDEGIVSYEKAEAYFASREEKVRYERIVRRLFGLGERKLTGAEEQMLGQWRTVFSFGEEMLTAAYERTVQSAKNPSIRYMHKILESWHRDGIATPDAIGKASQKREMAEKSYDLDDYFEKAVSRGRKEL